MTTTSPAPAGARPRGAGRPPRLLDLFCKAGGTSMGYHLAGFDVTGADIEPQKNYPFEFIQADALDLLADRDLMATFDAVAGSPPCQRFSDLAHRTGKDYPDLLGPTRDAMRATGLPYVIENVEGAPLVAPIWLCGTEFGLSARARNGQRRYLRRHRGFETSFFAMGAGGCSCHGRLIGGIYGDGGGGQQTRGWRYETAEQMREALQTPWMSRREMSQAIPPAYTRHIGEALMDHLRQVTA